MCCCSTRPFPLVKLSVVSRCRRAGFLIGVVPVVVPASCAEKIVGKVFGATWTRPREANEALQVPPVYHVSWRRRLVLLGVVPARVIYVPVVTRQRWHRAFVRCTVRRSVRFPGGRFVRLSAPIYIYIYIYIHIYIVGQGPRNAVTLSTTQIYRRYVCFLRRYIYSRTRTAECRHIVYDPNISGVRLRHAAPR